MKTVSLISIGSTRHIDFIRNKLDNEFKLLQAEGVQINFHEKASGDYTFLGYDIEANKNVNSNNLRTTFKQYVAKIISDLVIAKWEENLVARIIKNNYSYFTIEEKNIILEKALDILRNDDHIQRKNKVLLKVLDYLENNDDLIIEGFIKFRLKEYLNDLEDVVNKAVDDFLMEKEYNEFIRLLRYFVDIQDPRIDLVHVLLKPSGLFTLYDGNENVISNEYLEGLIVDLPTDEINYDDLLISALITIAPKRIILHAVKCKQTKNTVTTIQNVFGERVIVCEGCPKCKSSKFEL